MFYNSFYPSYTEWKAVRTALGGTTYYVQYDNRYLGILVDETVSGRLDVYRIDIIRDRTDSNLVDFETNIKPTATLKLAVDDAIADELN